MSGQGALVQVLIALVYRQTLAPKIGESGLSAGWCWMVLDDLRRLTHWLGFGALAIGDLASASGLNIQSTGEEFAALRSQSVASNAGNPPGRGGRRTAPYAFTEQGAAMLSSVLGSPRAIAVNIEIMRTFVRVRALAATHGDLAKRLAELEEKTEALAMNHETFSHNTRNQLKQVFDALRELMTPCAAPGDS
jgi:hypothetical protein